MAITLDDLPKLDIRQMKISGKSLDVPVMRGNAVIYQTINLAETPCNYGGVRHWFECPHCERRAAVLYLHGYWHSCRKCLGLPYRTQNMNIWSRLWKRKRAILKCLQWENEDGFMKPRGMHQDTFQNLLAKLRQVDERLLAATRLAFQGIK